METNPHYCVQLHTDIIVFWQGFVLVMLPAQIQDQLVQTVVLVDPGDRLLDDVHDPAERAEEKTSQQEALLKPETLQESQAAFAASCQLTGPLGCVLMK